jgi:hypothetical protein
MIGCYFSHGHAIWLALIANGMNGSCINSGCSSTALVTTCNICTSVALGGTHTLNGGSKDRPIALSMRAIPPQVPETVSCGALGIRSDLHFGCQKLALSYSSAAQATGGNKSTNTMRSTRSIATPKWQSDQNMNRWSLKFPIRKNTELRTSPRLAKAKIGLLNRFSRTHRILCN